jgi:hypothetical protein
MTVVKDGGASVRASGGASAAVLASGSDKARSGPPVDPFAGPHVQRTIYTFGPDGALAQLDEHPRAESSALTLERAADWSQVLGLVVAVLGALRIFGLI